MFIFLRGERGGNPMFKSQHDVDNIVNNNNNNNDNNNSKT